MSGTLARWRVAARIARRDARRNRARTALVAVLVGLPVLLGSAGSVVILSSYATDARQMEWMLGDEAQALVGAPVAEGMVQDLLGTSASWSTDGPADVDLASFEEQLREALPAADALSRSVTVEASLVSASHRTPPSAHVTSLPDVTVPGRFPVASGALPTAAGEVALSHAYADRLGVGVGDSVSMELADGSATRLGVTGILGRTALGPPAVVAPGSLEAPAGAFPAGRVTTPAALTSVAWYVVGPEAVTWEQVLAVNELGAPVTSRSVVLDPPPRSAVPYYAGGGGASVDTRAVAVAGLVGGLVVLEAVLLIGPAFAVAARRSQRQLAVLAAVGADRRTMRASVLLVGSVTGLAASVVGVVGGVVIGAVVRWVVRLRSPFAMPDMRLSVWLLLALVAFGLVVTTLAAWLPARRASRVDVVAALGGRRAEAAPNRRVPVVGVLGVALGALVAAVGVATGQSVVLLGGVAVLELGVIAASGGLVVLAARLAPRVRLAGRLALRDAARHRSRTAPAVAAVLAAVAGAVAGAVYLSSADGHQAAGYAPAAAPGTVLVGFSVPVEDDAEVVARTGEEVRASLPVTALVPVRAAVPTGSDSSSVGIQVSTVPGQECPLWADGTEPTLAESRAAADDPRCAGQGWWSSGGLAMWRDPVSGMDVLVDDGTVLRALGYAESDLAADALAAGRVVVGSATSVFPDGTAELTVTDFGTDGDGGVLAAARVPAVAVDLPGVQYSLVLPPSALEPLGLSSTLVGLVGPTSVMPEPAEVRAVGREVGAVASVAVETGRSGEPANGTMLVLVIAAVVAGIVATGVTIALAAADSVPDLATLSAVGASQRVRRRFAAAQAVVIAGLGGWIGVPTGLALGWALVTMQATAYRDWTWQTIIPWATVGAILVLVPVAAMALGWSTTRSRLPAVRRAAW